MTDRWLRVFVAASDASSFTHAAEDLEVTQSAVSHTVSRLEKALGVALFDRNRSGATLTEVGEQLAERVAAGFAVVDTAVDQLRAENASDAVLTVSVSTSLATHWLMPRLAGFKRAHPGVELRCLTSDTDAAIGRDGADLWIPLGRGPWPGFHRVDFCAEELYPVATPELLTDHGIEPEALAAEPGRIVELPMLHLEERYNPRFDWSQWFEYMGHDSPRRLPGVISNDYSLILQAALDGQGVALGWHHIVGGLVESGRLVRLSKRSVTTDEPFVILAKSEPIDGADAALFRAWLIEQAGGSQN